MKRYYYYIASLLFVGASLTGCSDDEIVTEKTNVSLEQALMPSEYSVSLDATTETITSKAAISSNKGSFSTDTLGVFMLAMDEIDTPLSQYWSVEYGMDCSWYRDKKDTRDSKIYGYSYGFSAYLDNMLATASPKDNAKPELGSTISLQNGKAERYPIGSFHKYNFYAYTPRVPEIRYYRDSVMAVMTELDGTQDVIYSAAIPGDAYNPINDSYADYAWSANYFRFTQNRTNDGSNVPLESLTPKFHFTHKMMQLMFSIQPGGLNSKKEPVDESAKTGKLDYTQALETEVIGISIVNVPDSVFLLVAERAGLHNGEITYSSKNRTKEFFLRSYIMKKVGSRSLYYADQIMPAQSMFVKNGEPVVTKLGGPDDTHRQGIILPALTNKDRKSMDGSYVAKVVVRYPKSSEDAKYYTIDVPLYSDPEAPDMQFQAGCSYEVKLRVYGPNTVKASSQQGIWYEVSQQELYDSGNYDVPEPPSEDEDSPTGNNN